MAYKIRKILKSVSIVLESGWGAEFDDTDDAMNGTSAFESVVAHRYIYAEGTVNKSGGQTINGLLFIPYHAVKMAAAANQSKVADAPADTVCGDTVEDGGDSGESGKDPTE